MVIPLPRQKGILIKLSNEAKKEQFVVAFPQEIRFGESPQV